jgi:uncharacterized membrane protein YeiH
VAPEHSLTLVVTDLVGIFVFAVTGALVGVRKELDVFGVLVLARTTGLGGGFVRDVLIGAAPPAALGAGLCFVWRVRPIWGHWHAQMPQGSASV